MLINGSLAKRYDTKPAQATPRGRVRLRIVQGDDARNTERVLDLAVAFITGRKDSHWMRPRGHRCGPDCRWVRDNDNWMCSVSGIYHVCGTQCNALVETRGALTCVRTGSVVCDVSESTFEEVMQSSANNEPLENTEKLRRAAGRAADAIAHPPRQTNSVRNNYDGRSVVAKWLLDAMASYDVRLAARLPVGLLDYLVDTTLRLWVLVSFIEAAVHRERRSSYGIKSHCLVSLVYMSRNDGFSTGLVDANNVNLLPNSITLSRTGLSRFLATRSTFTPTNKTMRLLISRIPSDKMAVYVATMKRPPDCESFDSADMEVDSND